MTGSDLAPARAEKVTTINRQEKDEMLNSSVPRVSNAVLRPLTSTGWQDLVVGLAKIELWGRLGWLDVKRRYRRTTIGPFWNSVTLAMYVISVGFVGSALSQQSLRDYLPFLASGMVVWMFVSTIISESCGLLVAGHPLFRNIRFEYSILAYALVWRNFIVFLHNLVVYLLIVLIFKPQALNFATPLVIPGLIFILINGVWVALLCGMFCLRYRDVNPLVGTLMQISMLVTPLFWPADILSGQRRFLFVELNPLYHLIEVVRAPLLGNVPPLTSYAAVLVITLAGWWMTVVIFERYRKRITFWS